MHNIKKKYIVFRVLYSSVKPGDAAMRAHRRDIKGRFCRWRRIRFVCITIIIFERYAGDGPRKVLRCARRTVLPTGSPVTDARTRGDVDETRSAAIRDRAHIRRRVYVGRNPTPTSEDRERGRRALAVVADAVPETETGNIFLLLIFFIFFFLSDG